MYGPITATRVMACLLVALLAGGVGVAPRRAFAQVDEEARVAFNQLERQVLKEIAAHLEYLALPHKLSGSMNADGVLKLTLQVTTSDLRKLEDVQELAGTIATRLAEWMRVRWPRLSVSPESQIVTRRPFSFTEQLPELSASIAVSRGPRRKLSVALVPAPRPAPRAATRPGPRVAGPAGGLVVKGPTRDEVLLHNRVQRVFQGRWIVNALEVKISAPSVARTRMRITMVSQGLARDRQRLRRATIELTQVLKVAGGYAPAEGSEVKFALHDAKSGANVGGLLAIFREARWRIDGEEPPLESAPATTLRPKRLVGQPNAGGLPPVSARPAVAGSLPERNRPPRKHPLPVPPVDEERSGPHRQLSTEDLIAFPGSIVGHVGTARARVRATYRRTEPGAYSDVGEVQNLSLGGSVSVVTARRLQATFGYAHTRQKTELSTLAELDSSGDAVVFSLKYRTPPALRRHAHLAVGADLPMQSRTDETFRVPEDYAQIDSFWVTYNLWTSPISLVHLLIKRVGLFSSTREYVQYGLAQELVAHHPFRRAYWELVADDRVDKSFTFVGVPQAEPVALNVGAELELGRRATLQINAPRLFSERYRQMQLVLSIGI